MKLIDINVLIYATNPDSPYHERLKAWWEGLLRSSESIALPWIVLTGYVRVATNRSTSADPIPPEQAIGCVEKWLALPNVHVVSETPDFWTLFDQLVAEAGRGGNLVADAHLAAIAIGNGATLSSCETDFARFSKLRWENPLAVAQ